MKRCAVILVKGKDSTYLMGKRRDNGKLTFPAGHLNDGEDPRVGAARELKEETGFAATKLIPKGCFMPAAGVLIYVYEASVSDKPNLENDPDMEFQSIFYKDPKTVTWDEWHVKPDWNCALKTIKA